MEEGATEKEESPQVAVVHSVESVLPSLNSWLSTGVKGQKWQKKCDINQYLDNLGR